MISFTLLTSTPLAVKNFLINRGLMQEIPNPIGGGTQLVGVRDGVEFTINAVPNPIVVTPSSGTPGQPDYVPPVMDDRKVYLVKLTRDAETDETAGFEQTDPGSGNPGDPDYVPPSYKPVDLRTKLGAWVRNNGVRDDIDVNGTTVPAFRVGNNVWLARDPDGLFGTWQ